MLSCIQSLVWSNFFPLKQDSSGRMFLITATAYESHYHISEVLLSTVAVKTWFVCYSANQARPN